MKKIFIYYSHSGNGDLVAKKMEELGYEVRKVYPKHDLPKSFFGQMMVGGMLSAMNHRSRLNNYNANLTDYDEVVIGSPIWNSSLSCSINRVLKISDFANKKLSFILYSGSGEAKNALKRIESKYPASNTVVLKEPKKYPQELEKLINY